MSASNKIIRIDTELKKRIRMSLLAELNLQPGFLLISEMNLGFAGRKREEEGKKNGAVTK